MHPAVMHCVKSREYTYAYAVMVSTSSLYTMMRLIMIVSRALPPSAQFAL